MADIEVGHYWAPITDLGEHDLAAASTELPPLLRTWEEFRQELPELQVREFNERLHREWAIETGIIERLYTLDEGTTKLLIEQGIDASFIPHSDVDEPPELIAGMIADHLDAVEWLFDVITQRRPLSTSFVKELHQLMTRKQQFAAGVDQFGRAVRLKLLHDDYKRRPNNPTRSDGKVHEYCPPEHVAAEMDQFINMHDRHLEDGVPADVSAAWLHHRFVQIHPFQDGNGRVARALASLALIRSGMFPLVVTNRDRERYIETLGVADSGDLTPLVTLVARLQKRWLVQALGNHGSWCALRLNVSTASYSRSARPSINVTELCKKSSIQPRRRQSNSGKHACLVLRDVGLQLQTQIKSAFFEREVFTESCSNDDLKRRSYYRYQVVDTAQRLDYFANMREHHSWVRLVIDTEQGKSEILLSFHGVNRDYRGLMAASMCFFRRQNGDVIEPQVIELQPVCDDLFQINYLESTESVLQRFRPWLKRLADESPRPVPQR